MIGFSQKESEVIISFSASYPISNNFFQAKLKCEHEWIAKLLANNLQKSLESALEKIRREEYLKGWKDAKAKRKKEDWFSRYF